MQTASILNVKGQSASKALKNSAKKVVQAEARYLSGYHIVDLILCASGVAGAEQDFRCLMRSSWDKAAEQFLAGPDQKYKRSIIDITREKTINEIKQFVMPGRGL